MSTGRGRPDMLGPEVGEGRKHFLWWANGEGDGVGDLYTPSAARGQAPWGCLRRDAKFGNDFRLFGNDSIASKHAPPDPAPMERELQRNPRIPGVSPVFRLRELLMGRSGPFPFREVSGPRGKGRSPIQWIRPGTLGVP